MQTYITHDNGSRPLKVTVQNNNINIYNFAEYYENEDIYDTEPLLSYEVEKVFVGKSPNNPMTVYSGAHGPDFDGNSILLLMSHNHYLFIGQNIYSFRSYHPIKEYVSPVGNNDVPYPYAIDTANNYYLMIEDVVLTKVPEKMEDPYEFYYQDRLMTEDRGRIPPRKPSVKDFDGITEWYVGDEQYTMICASNPEKDYERMTAAELPETMYVIRDGQKEELTKDQYIELMHNLAERQGYKLMKDVKIIQARSW